MNWSLLFTSEITTKAISFFTVILLARGLNPAGFGDFNLIISVAAIFAVIANFGMTQVLTRLISREPRKGRALLFGVFRFRLFTALLSSAGLILYFISTGGHSDITLLLFAALYVFSLTAFDLAECVAFGKQVMKISALLNSLASGAWLLALLFFPSGFVSVKSIFVTFVMIDATKTVYYYSMLKKHLRDDSPASEKMTSPIIRQSVPFLWLWILGALGTNLPVILLDRYANAESIGIFAVGMRVLVPFGMIITTLMKAIFPSLSKLYYGDKQLFARRVFDGTLMILLIAGIAGAFFSYISEPFVLMFFGQPYRGAVTIIVYMTWFTVVYVADIFIGTALSASDRQNTLAALATLDFLVMLPLMLWGAKSGAASLAFAKFVTGCIVFCYHWVVVYKITADAFNTNLWIRAVVAVSMLALVSLNPFGISNGLQGLGLIFISVLFILSMNPVFASIRNRGGNQAHLTREGHAG